MNHPNQPNPRGFRVVAVTIAAVVALLAAACADNDTRPPRNAAAADTTTTTAAASTAAVSADPSTPDTTTHTDPPTQERFDCPATEPAEGSDEWFVCGWDQQPDEPAPETTTTPPDDDHGHTHEDGTTHSHNDESGHSHDVESGESHSHGDETHSHPFGEEPHTHDADGNTWVGSGTTDPVAVVDPLWVEEQGHELASPDDPPPAPEPDPLPEPDPGLPDCVAGEVLDGPCIDPDYRAEQSVDSQRNKAFGGSWLSGPTHIHDATSQVVNHPRDHHAHSHRQTVPHPDFPFNNVEGGSSAGGGSLLPLIYDAEALAALRPAARGEQPQPLPGHRHGHFPPFTPAVQAWSDWCYFDAEFTYDLDAWRAVDWPWDDPTPPGAGYFCTLELHTMSFYLSHLESPEECVLPLATERIENAARLRTTSAWWGSSHAEIDAKSAFYERTDYMNCPNMIYPNPDLELTPRQHFDIKVRYAGIHNQPFEYFYSGAVSYLDPGEELTQRQWRREVIWRIPNFILGM